MVNKIEVKKYVPTNGCYFEKNASSSLKLKLSWFPTLYLFMCIPPRVYLHLNLLPHEAQSLICVLY